MKYVYPAVFEVADEGGYVVYFPDLQTGATQGENLIECMDAAEKFLGDAMCFIEDEKRDIPCPSVMSDIKARNGDVLTLISVDTMEYRRKYENKAECNNKVCEA